MIDENQNNSDNDPTETQEWIDALVSVVKYEGAERAQFLLNQVLEKAHTAGVNLSTTLTTPYINTISADIDFPGDEAMEERITTLMRWNAWMMVLRAVHKAAELGGHLSTYSSAAALYEVGFNHFFRGPTENFHGDLLFIQGHSSPGIYARAFLEGRLSEEQLDNFRQEVEKDGLSSYPHPWLMQKFWQFPTVSMGLGPLMAIYQARFLKYLANRGLVADQDRKVWAFCGDGEMDEVESRGALAIAARDNLDNLIFVINCNLQRLDGPVRSNGKIIQELESFFRGAGWNVIKVIWGSNWDALLAKDKSGLLQKRMMEVVDGDYQTYRAKNGAYIREHFFGKYPELKELVADMSDDDIWQLKRGGLDIKKVYSAYAAAVKHKGQPTVILAKSVKGYGMSDAGEGQNIAHNQKKMAAEQLQAFRDRFHLNITDQEIAEYKYLRPAANSPEIRYLQEKRKALGSYLPQRRTHSSETLKAPSLELFQALLENTGDREVSTTMAFVRLITALVKDKQLGARVVPIVPDECRTFGMEGLFRQIGIYSPQGQLYEPVDKGQIAYYREEKKGQILEEGINEAGAFASWIAAATSYSTNDLATIPFYVYYSMFGYQRVGDLIWAAGDMQARGFIMGATAGRTTLAGEGLQHQDGHNLLMFSFVPNCVAYDPTFSYELAVIVREGLRRMLEKQESVFYYITLMNENYFHPDMPKDAEAGILKGMYLFRPAKAKTKLQVQLLGSGTILREVITAAEMLEKDYGIGAEVWSVTSFSELHREASAVERYNRLHPTTKPQISYVAESFKDSNLIVAATDYIRLNAEQIRPFISAPYMVLGTDGYGRSDTRKRLRHFFEVDHRYIICATLKALADAGAIATSDVVAAMKKYEINAEKPNPLTV
jgi:pyruvate dehydrogenase E1 component